jgi:hypothetical protein
MARVGVAKKDCNQRDGYWGEIQMSDAKLRMVSGQTMRCLQDLKNRRMSTPYRASHKAAVPPAATSSTYPCKILSKDGAFYNVEEYENGIDSTTTGTAKVFILQLNFGDTLPAGTWIMASESAMGSTGGGNVP